MLPNTSRLLWAVAAAITIIAGCQCQSSHHDPDAGTPDDTPVTDGGTSSEPDSGSNASCDPNPCGSAGRSQCAIENGQVVCSCDPGTHDENGLCVADAHCLPTSCDGHGTCNENNNAIQCACDPGFTGTSCSSCDSLAGYHSDGQGGCTTNGCLPNPCSAANTQCTGGSDGGIAACVCIPGYHDENGACVIDEVCTGTTCGGHGTCSVVLGRTSCACNAGYSGASCSSCDSAGGYHSDGAGGCTNDVCIPNPCTGANKTVCAASSSTTQGYLCSCDTGYHDDGVGNCTNDPCQPNPCAATNQACRTATTSTGYECFTPVCNDNNPCTNDTLVGGVCQHSNLANGSACSTSLCTSGQTCQAGACTGGSAVTCNDNNPCTRDSCNPTTGCSYTNDNTLIPDDGIACTQDSCNNGVKSNTATDSLCNDNLWCTGTERCLPSDPTAVGGCVHQNVPKPPDEPWSPCRSYGACNESTQSFPLTQQPTGTACNDRIACTTGDACTAQGACVGSVQSSCDDSYGAQACVTTSQWQSGIDFSLATIEGTVTMNGGAVPSTSYSSSSLDFYVIDRTTGARQYIGGPQWPYNSSTFPYPLTAGSATYKAKILPGIYDLAYRRGYNTTLANGERLVYSTDTRDTVPYGDQLIAKNVVIGPGRNVRNIDFSMATISGTVRMNGGAVPATSYSSSSLDFYLIDRTTGARQYIGGPQWPYNSSTFPYPLTAGSDQYTAKVLPGTYDLLYRRGYNTTTASGEHLVYSTDVRDSTAYGDQILRTGIVIAPGAQTLDIDFSMATISGTVTMNGGAVPATSYSSSSLDFYLLDRTTGARQYIGGPQWPYNSSTFPYPLSSGSNQYQAKILPGTYDLLYRRGYNTTTANGEHLVYQTDVRDSTAYGDHLLRTGVVIPAGASTLNIDFSMTDVSGAITMNGGSVPSTSYSSSSLDFYLIDKTTGARQYIGGPQWPYNSSTFPYPLTAGSNQFRAKIVPGTYDLLYRRGYNTTTASGEHLVYATDVRDSTAYGDHILATGVVFAPGVQTYAIDFSMGDVSGTITMNGGAVPSTSYSSSSLDFYLIDRTTGARQYIGGPQWPYNSSTFPYPLTTGSNQYRAKVVPGTYDLLYRRGYNTTTATGEHLVYETDDRDTVAYGDHILQKGIVIPAGVSTFSINFSMATVSGTATMNGGAVPGSSYSSSSLDFYVINRSTGARQYIGGPQWPYNSSTFPYPKTTGSENYLSKLVPGTYDLLYRRGYNTTTSSGEHLVYSTDVRDSTAYGDQRIGVCLNVQ